MRKANITIHQVHHESPIFKRQEKTEKIRAQTVMVLKAFIESKIVAEGSIRALPVGRAP